MLGDRSLSRPFDNEQAHEHNDLLDSEDIEVAQRYPKVRRPRWTYPKLIQRSTLYWALLLLVTIIIAFYAWSDLGKRQIPILKAPIPYGHEPIEDVNAKPSDVKIVGIVFYGRRQYVDIMDCYLQRNLAINGGYLDEVHFLIHTDKQGDVDWLQNLVDRTPGYSSVVANGTFGEVWHQHASESDTLYVKIDDDMTYIHDNAIPRMVHTLIDNPESYAVSANVINSPEGHWLHYHTNAIVPYLPEPEEANVPLSTRLTSWRPSELPKYPRVPIADHYNMDAPAPRDHLRWLQLPRNYTNLHKTPIHAAAYEWEGVGAHSWALGAQQHASLFSNIEDDTLDRYSLGDENGVWNMQNYRYSINFIAIWGSTVQISDIGVFDEHDIAVKNPQELGRPFLIDGHALVAHFSFGPQHKELLRTDFLDRYRAYANEMICGKDNQKVPIE
ncbi:MAG: hypothetical protein M1822_006026 [Bathelium mastoideum]|nr:MAG: hypothetical protein M1822_006026 [Bathelium mastoideum]